MATSPFIVIPEMTAVAVAYPNGKFIAEDVAPYVPVDSIDFRYRKFSAGDDTTVPDTLIGRKGAPQQVEWTESEVASFVQDHGLDSPVPNIDVEAWQLARAKGLTASTDPMLRATSQTMKLVMTKREQRVANLVFNAATYGAANKVSMVSGSRFSDEAVKPQYLIGDAMDSMMVRPNYVAFGRQSWTKTSRNPNLVKAAYGLGTEQGQVTRKLFAEMFELDDVFVGDGFINIAPKGQPVQNVRLWGKHCAFFHRDMSADTQFGMSFAFTARFGERIGGITEVSGMGLRGGKLVRAGESVRELVTANDLGYYFENCVD